MITACSIIKPPKSWAQWIKNSIEKIENGTLTSPQTLMNDAVLKYTKNITFEDSFAVSFNTIHEYIVFMMGEVQNKRPRPTLICTEKRK